MKGLEIYFENVYHMMQVRVMMRSTATVHSVFLESCVAEPCVIHVQQNYTVRIVFTARVNHDKAYNFASGDVIGIGRDEIWYFKPNDACIDSVKCPIQAGLQQTYSKTVTIPITSSRRMAAKWQVKDSNDPAAPPIICFVIPITIIGN
ncbi:uncharacterized protein LOC132739464 [Ruditapes philippinarum]|uniref:uncharacterized protein LOC132739464 n=1 Tax=Ruditapes philippinarum TaxID=129788 RepID=UPI00295B7BD7|nr:uncharacterized protein LOC132739464 [Ruditapes philippinarum]